MEITLSYTNIIGIIERSLAIIGKRSVDDNGQPLYKDIILGSREKGILKDHIDEAVQHVVAESAAFVSDSSINDTDSDTITLTLPYNHNTALEPFIQRSFNTYCVTYTLYSWFTVTAPTLAKKYQDSSTLQLTALVKLIHEKQAPKAPIYPYPTAILIRYPIIAGRDSVPGFTAPDISDVVDPLQLFSFPWSMNKGEMTEISYTLVGEDGHMPKDDIIVRADNTCCQPFMDGGGWWSLKGVHKGTSVITLYSRHNDQVKAQFVVEVS